jgi:hypothetical protein
MSPLAHAILDPFVGTLLVLALLAVVGIPVYFFAEKTNTGIRFMSWIENMGLSKEEIEDPYDGFRIHPNNYVKSR